MSWRDVVARRAEREERENRDLPPGLRPTDTTAWLWFFLLTTGMLVAGGILLAFPDRVRWIPVLAVAYLGAAFVLRFRRRPPPRTVAAGRGERKRAKMANQPMYWRWATLALLCLGIFQLAARLLGWPATTALILAMAVAAVIVVALMLLRRRAHAAVEWEE